MLSNQDTPILTRCGPEGVSAAAPLPGQPGRAGPAAARAAAGGGAGPAARVRLAEPSRSQQLYQAVKRLLGPQELQLGRPRPKRRLASRGNVPAACFIMMPRRKIFYRRWKCKAGRRPREGSARSPQLAGGLQAAMAACKAAMMDERQRRKALMARCPWHCRCRRHRPVPPSSFVGEDLAVRLLPKLQQWSWTAENKVCAYL